MTESKMGHGAIPLPSQSYLRECFGYCPESGKLYWLPRPRSHFNTEHGHLVANGSYPGKEASALSSTGHLMVGIDGVRYKVHRVIWKYWHGTDPDVIDHINHDRADNRISNLRDVTQFENLQNRKLEPGPVPQSGVRGVTYKQDSKKWMVRVWDRETGKLRNFGLYRNLEEAIEKRKAIELADNMSTN